MNPSPPSVEDVISEESERELRAALDRIEHGKTPPPMKDPYTGLPMSRAQRRAMKKRVQRRLKKMKKGESK